ncbi:hypothetical protein KSP40_PGU018000 [Platanthera guangdongensis]|uniref:CASP-like protein n=1 Tax=Platanthera guangdongensis TaxID=2320717 RepID=A0ABR2MWE5_9ASPA
MKDLHLNLRFFEIFLRLSVLPLAISSAVMVSQANDTSYQYGDIQFTRISAFRFLLSVNCISALYALISAALLIFLKENKTSSWGFFLLDQLVVYLMVTSSSAAAELLYLAHEGDREISWSEVCSYFGRFCSRAKISLILHFWALLCFICFSLASAFRVFSKFEPPSVTSDKEVEGNEGD